MVSRAELLMKDRGEMHARTNHQETKCKSQHTEHMVVMLIQLDRCRISIACFKRSYAFGRRSPQPRRDTPRVK